MEQEKLPLMVSDEAIEICLYVQSQVTQKMSEKKGILRRGRYVHCARIALGIDAVLRI